MIVALAAALAAAVLGLLRGGSLDRLAETRFRWTPLLFAALAVQVAASFVADVGGALGLTIVLGTNAAAAAFLLVNRNLPGMTLAALGLLMNVAVIAANGAMPVSRRAAEIAGVSTTELDDAAPKHEPMTDDTALTPLGDVIPVPGFRSIFSPGDVVLAAGIAVLVYRRTTSQDASRTGVAPVG
jgi:hypothetical protein